MTLLLPRPYPDELVGSMLGRAARQTGLSLKRLIQQLTGTCNTSHPAAITRYSGVASAFGFELGTFLSEHTHYPYMTAFWKQDDRDAMTRNLLDPDCRINVAFISQNSGKAVSSLRRCPDCISEDVRQYGESYWKRSHQLPGVSYCIVHEGILKETAVDLSDMLKAPPPNLVSDRSARLPPLGRVKALKVAQVSVAALEKNPGFVNPTFEYRQRAMSLGYGLNSTDIYTDGLSHDFQLYYGRTFLESLGCGLHQVNRTWVSSLVGTMNTHWTALRHVLLLAFLESNPVPSRNPRDHMTRNKPRHIDWSVVEKAAIKSIQKNIVTHRTKGTRTTVKNLLTDAGFYGTYSHNRQRFENLTEVLVEFKASPQSERQTGKRPRKYVKTYLP